jgi:heat shock protein HtpX
MLYTSIEKNKRNTIILIILFSFFILGIGFIMSQAMENYIFIIIAFAISLIINLIGYYQGDKLILKLNSAKSIKKAEAPELYRLVENLAITAGLTTPKIYIINDEAPNAFATGRDPEHASITVTIGLLNVLNKQELEGVIAHELSHIKNYDIRLTMMVIMLVGITIMMSDLFLRIGARIGGRKKGNARIFFFIAAIALAILSPIVAKIIQFAISRQREFLADADSALMTRYPEGLASALEKIGKLNIPMKSPNKATANLYIANPYASKKSLSSRLFATHPAISDRVNKLRNFNF